MPAPLTAEALAAALAADIAAGEARKEDDARTLARSIANCRNGGYRDALDGYPPNAPAWGTIPAWSNAYAEGYALGREARARLKRPAMRQETLDL